MHKKEFIALADAISYHNRQQNALRDDRDSHRFSDEHLSVLADFCRSQNPNFDRERWLGYIDGSNGPSGGKRKP